MDEVLNLIESVSEGFPSYFYIYLFTVCDKFNFETTSELNSYQESFSGRYKQNEE